MKKISFYTSFNLSNKIFDITDDVVNRDNFAYSYFKLRHEFYTNDLDLSTMDINSIEESESVIFNDAPDDFIILDTKKKKYLLAMESKLIKPDNFNYKLHEKFDKIFTWNDELVDGIKYIKINFSHLFPSEIDKINFYNKKLCTLISGNKKVKHPLELYSSRVEAVRWFEKNHPNDFDLYGVGWDIYTHSNKYINFILRKTGVNKLITFRFSSYKGKVKAKGDVLKKYKFAICYENARDIPGYITEKIFDCFFAGCVPIYWGANNIHDHIPSNCFIDRRKFSTYEELYIYMTNMPEDEYSVYLDNIEFFCRSSKSNPFRAENFAKTIVNTILEDLAVE